MFTNWFFLKFSTINNNIFFVTLPFITSLYLCVLQNVFFCLNESIMCTHIQMFAILIKWKKPFIYYLPNPISQEIKYSIIYISMWYFLERRTVYLHANFMYKIINFIIYIDYHFIRLVWLVLENCLLQINSTKC